MYRGFSTQFGRFCRSNTSRMTTSTRFNSTTRTTMQSEMTTGSTTRTNTTGNTTGGRQQQSNKNSSRTSQNNQKQQESTSNTNNNNNNNNHKQQQSKGSRYNEIFASQTGRSLAAMAGRYGKMGSLAVLGLDMYLLSHYGNVEDDT
jgi:hypothetical protein